MSSVVTFARRGQRRSQNLARHTQFHLFTGQVCADCCQLFLIGQRGRDLWPPSCVHHACASLQGATSYVRSVLVCWEHWSSHRPWDCFSARLPSKLKLWSSKTKLFCETSLKKEILTFLRDFLQNWSFEAQSEAFLGDFLQNWSFEAQKRNISARLPSKLKLWRSKTKLFCETSFKNEALKIKNEALLRDFLQKWSVEAQKRSFCARLPSRMKLWRSKTEAFLRDFLQKWHVDQTLDLRIPIRFNDF